MSELTWVEKGLSANDRCILKERCTEFEEASYCVADQRDADIVLSDLRRARSDAKAIIDAQDMRS